MCINTLTEHFGNYTIILNVTENVHGIKLVDTSSSVDDLAADENALCPFCEMAVFWMQVELRKKKTKDHVLKYVSEVNV